MSETAKPKIEVGETYPTVGKETTIVLPQPAEKVVVTYQPGAPVAREQLLDAAGQSELTWTPEQAGVVAITADGVSKNVSVKFDGLPVLGLIIMIAAGTILLGGAATCLRALFAHPE